ncbi:hypothetical protein DIS24_g9580 [Lasiodiplodia hormozganensis]|uniref:Uncharacterized protein n=1 Tax=Lasiodiplodia hormozganensis TaxID=869390 RepID=A0AA39XU17_9PEZI|nr:Biotrophy-associated secreted protein [Lasiodiplodia theobromae]KAF4537433.1 Biotrophy-associated secreted protein [Lasiodiplodia theobromae]KAK0640213.1 hypothetical protein DIS24_g9580 [Lasiodiplodia hormozganensis]
MQFSVILLGLFTAIAAAQQSPFAQSQCSNTGRAGCDPSSDGVQRCVALDEVDLCVADCDAASTCASDCKSAGYSNGYCTKG